MSSKPKKRVKKLVLVLAISTLVTATRKKIVETTKTVEAVKTAGACKNGKDGKDGENPGNFAQVL